MCRAAPRSASGLGCAGTLSTADSTNPTTRRAAMPIKDLGASGGVRWRQVASGAEEGVDRGRLPPHSCRSIVDRK